MLCVQVELVYTSEGNYNVSNNKWNIRGTCPELTLTFQIVAYITHRLCCMLMGKHA
jgi:hypothetical protein